MQERYDFDEVAVLSAVAVGSPGKRTFFLAVGGQSDWVRVWLEKQELQALAAAIRQLLSAISEGRVRAKARAGESPEEGPSGFPAAELEIDEISLGYDKERATLECVVHPVGPKRENSAALKCSVTLAQLKRFGRQAEKVCAAGRPICALCGGPIDPTGHFCPASN